MASLQLTWGQCGRLQCVHTTLGHSHSHSPLPRQSCKSRRTLVTVFLCAQAKETSAFRAAQKEEEGSSNPPLQSASEEPGGLTLPGPTAAEARAFAGVADSQDFIPVNAKSKGAAMADFLLVYGGLLDRPFGSAQIIAASGRVVTSKVKELARDLQERNDGVDGQALFELLRAVSLLEADLQLLRAASKDETLLQRLEVAKMHCRQAFLIANSL